MYQAIFRDAAGKMLYGFEDTSQIYPPLTMTQARQAAYQQLNVALRDGDVSSDIFEAWNSLEIRQGDESDTYRKPIKGPACEM